MLPGLSNVPTSGTTTESSGLALLIAAAGVVFKDMNIQETQGRQTQHMPNDAAIGCSSAKNRKISNFSIKAASVSETGIVCAGKEKDQHNQCSKAFQFSRNLKQHTGNMHATEPRKKYQDCGNSLKNKKSLDVHNKNKHGNHKREYRCGQCGSTLRSPKSLKRHIRNIHVTEPRKKCPDCKMTFKNDQTLAVHKKHKHGNRERKHACNECDKTFLCPSYLRQHVRSVHEAGLEPRKQCNHCPKTFKNKRSLYEHTKRKHGEYEKQYKRDQCSQPFALPSRSSQHSLA